MIMETREEVGEGLEVGVEVPDSQEKATCPGQSGSLDDSSQGPPNHDHMSGEVHELDQPAMRIWLPTNTCWCMCASLLHNKLCGSHFDILLVQMIKHGT